MIKKEKEMRSKNLKYKQSSIIYDEKENFYPAVKNVNSTNNNSVISENVVENSNEKEATKEPTKNKNYHGDQCKTCSRMKNIMGEDNIVPHPINV